MKRTITLMALFIILVCGIAGVKSVYDTGTVTYDGVGRNVNVVDLYNNPTVYDEADPDGVADIIVKENLEKTMAANNVAAIVFDFRGFDTLGESFILLTAIAGSFVILSITRKKKGGAEE